MLHLYNNVIRLHGEGASDLLLRSGPFEARRPKHTDRISKQIRSHSRLNGSGWSFNKFYSTASTQAAYQIQRVSYNQPAISDKSYEQSIPAASRLRRVFNRQIASPQPGSSRYPNKGSGPCDRSGLLWVMDMESGRARGGDYECATSVFYL